MQYPVVEIFQSLQGEGGHAGTAFNFIRLAGCPNNCEFCDTNYTEHTLMGQKDIWVNLDKKLPVVITGGEPLIHDLRPLLDLLQSLGKPIHLETSGAVDAPIHVLARFDWISLSPKKGKYLFVQRANEVKWLWPMWDITEIKWYLARHHFLQPINKTLDMNFTNVTACVTLLLETEVPFSKTLALSPQLHKLLGLK
jgi:organic radical activating enzyme